MITQQMFKPSSCSEEEVLYCHVDTCRTASTGGGGFLFLHRLERVQVTFLRKPTCRKTRNTKL